MSATNLIAIAQLLAAAVTAAATYALWRATKVLADETKTLSAMTSKPFVIFSFRSSQAAPTALDAIVSNTGNATAFNVRVTIDPTLPNANGSRPNDVTETVFNIALLPPGEILPRQGIMARDASEDTFRVKITWSSSPTSEHTESIQYDVSVHDGFKAGWSAKGMHQVADELEKIRRSLPTR